MAEREPDFLDEMIAQAAAADPDFPVRFAAAQARLGDRVGTRFEDYLAELKAGLSPAERARYDTLADRYRIANQLIELRQARKLSQRELAHRTGIAQAEISKIERGETDPRATTLARLARALGVHIALLPAPAAR